jgi:cellulose synthase/poly-beta-1,6-N-acetylglucosamine synthase-like glycosyltransferase
MEIAAISALVLTLIYVMVIGKMLRHWHLLSETSAAASGIRPLSIVITVRNEEKSLPLLLDDLLPQLAASADHEVIIVDDHSTDYTLREIQKKINGHPQIRVVTPTLITGKKNCQREGILLAKNEWIATLDGDVRIHRHWLNTLGQHLANTRAGLLVLPLIIDDQRNWWTRLQSLEFMSLVFITASSAAQGNALLCNGANLAFRKSLFNQFQQKRNDLHISSGDDIFFLEYAKKHDQVLWLHDQELIASTGAADHLRSFAAQRIRWASKAQRVDDKSYYYTALLVFFVNLSFVCGLVIIPFDHHWFTMLMIAFLIKMLIDFLVVRAVATWLCKTRLMRLFPLLVLVYPVYAILVPLVGIFWKPDWKGRRIKL